MWPSQKNLTLLTKEILICFSGDAIPHVEYTAEEIATWKEVYSKVVEIYPGKACSIQIQRLDIMMKACGFAVDNIPQMEDVSNYLKSNVT